MDRTFDIDSESLFFLALLCGGSKCEPRVIK